MPDLFRNYSTNVVAKVKPKSKLIEGSNDGNKWIAAQIQFNPINGKYSDWRCTTLFFDEDEKPLLEKSLKKGTEFYINLEYRHSERADRCKLHYRRPRKLKEVEGEYIKETSFLGGNIQNWCFYEDDKTAVFDVHNGNEIVKASLTVSDKKWLPVPYKTYCFTGYFSFMYAKDENGNLIKSNDGYFIKVPIFKISRIVFELRD